MRRGGFSYKSIEDSSVGVYIVYYTSANNVYYTSANLDAAAISAAERSADYSVVAQCTLGWDTTLTGGEKDNFQKGQKD